MTLQGASQVALMIKKKKKNPSANTGDMGSTPGLGRSLREEMATCSSILAWKILLTEDPGGL